ncbi:MAG TPA: hypothetical protein VGF55_15070, partial [Gemmataceae bacterium]
MATLVAPPPAAGGTGLLHYRPYRGRLGGPAGAVWAVARTGLRTILRRKLFWGLYALGLMMFLLFFFGQYLMAWAASQLGEDRVPVMGLKADPRWLITFFRDLL